MIHLTCNLTLCAKLLLLLILVSSGWQLAEAKDQLFTEAKGSVTDDWIPCMDGKSDTRVQDGKESQYFCWGGHWHLTSISNLVSLGCGEDDQDLRESEIDYKFSGNIEVWTDICPRDAIVERVRSDYQLIGIVALEAGECPPDGRNPAEPFEAICEPLTQWAEISRTVEFRRPPLVADCPEFESVGPWNLYSRYHQIATPEYCADGVTIKGYTIETLPGWVMT